ncbi:hypothetical protein E4U56_007326 [Claviceps arundinis]|uniref:Uncharacterized protein n=1 Tax=Claviceps arundinis TaxID=1623583 RepID=A0A9P7SLK6_9HYPO|nr:hypothetical protein E4U56_007326 [Claviceps arundinis]
MVHENFLLPLPVPRPQPVQQPFAPSGPPTTAPFSMAFSAHTSRARNIGVGNRPSHASNVHPMGPMAPPSFGNVMPEEVDPRVTTQIRLTAAALAQVKHLADPGDVPQYPIDELAPPCHPDCLDWILHWVEDHTRPGWRMSDLWMQPARPAPFWSDQIEGF